KPELADPIMRIFTEMQPLYVFLARPPFAIALAYVLAALVLLSILLRFRHYRLWEIGMLAGLAGLANVAIRSLQDWVMLMLALAMPQLVGLLAEAARKDRRRAWVRALLRIDASCKRVFAGALLRPQPGWLFAGVLGLLIVSLMPPWSRAM